METIVFCRKFFEATGIPVTLLRNAVPVYTSLGEMSSFQPDTCWSVYVSDRNPDFCAITPDLEYGHVHIEGTEDDLFIGPIFTTQIDEEIIAKFFSEVRAPMEYREALAEQLYAVPVGSHPRFLRYLLFLHLCLNHQVTDIESLYAESRDRSELRGQQEIQTAVERKEQDKQHNSYDFETHLYQLIQTGNLTKLKRFLESTQSFPEGGQKARSPLRHAKNAFIALASKAAVLGAIPGGVDRERVYQLTDLYIIECEQMQTIDEVHRLQYIMLMDFCQRCGEAHIPDGISSEIFRCMTYIENHTNAMITVEEIAQQIHRSRSCLTHRFRAETGMSVGEYISKCKMAEACDLLAFSEMSLAQISAYLGYSSQAYFQNLFKRAYAVTPLMYRKQHKAFS